MEGKASIQIGQVNNNEKQKISLTYYIGSFDKVQDAQAAKYAMDKVSEELGATIVNDACIIGENDNKEAEQTADNITLQIEQDEQPQAPTPETVPVSKITAAAPSTAI